ncbi:MAG: hypothetical protein ABI611_09155 [Solirubrobacteraceae bacterium]
MSSDAPSTRRFAPSPKEDLVHEIDRLGVELDQAAGATGSGRVPISARADFLRAQAAHQRAVVIWTAAGAEHQLTAAREALELCRDALGSMRERLRR